MGNIKNSLDATEMLNKIKTLRDTEINKDRRDGLELAVAILEDRNPVFEDSDKFGNEPIADRIIRERREEEIKKEENKEVQGGERDRTVSEETQKPTLLPEFEDEKVEPKKADLSPKKVTAGKK